jgi:cell division protein FtsI (penicillin-binding protein 3)
MLGRTDSRGRLLLILLVLVLAAAAIVARLGYWQVVRQPDLADQARRQTSIRTETPSRRGAIYDRSGVVVLATTVDRERLVASPKDLEPAQKRDAVELLTELLGLRAASPDIAELTSLLDEDRGYVVLARDIQAPTGDAIRAAIAKGGLPAMWLEPEPVRVYPQAGGGPDSTLAAHLLGFVNREGVGQYGVEQHYQAELGGTPRVVFAQRGAGARPLLETAVVAEPGEPGRDIRLTIDAGLQLAVEQELLAAHIADRAKSISAVVMDPYTGEVYAEATYPSYDSNAYRAIAERDPSRFIDPVVSQVYEPGSVFKMLTVVAGLESGAVTPSTQVYDSGTLTLDGGRAKVDDADRNAMGWMSFRDGIAWSRNVVAAKVALDLARTTRGSAARLHETWRRLGFGAPTGIDVAGEVGGIVNDPTVRTWQEIDLANGSFGQGVAVTPIQLAAAFSAMVNGGYEIAPHVVKAIGPDAVAVSQGSRVITPRLSRTLIGMMNHVVTEVPFYRDRTLIPGYFVGGKTGTAQIWNPNARGGKGAWKHNLFNYSFVGFVGREQDRPDLVIAVRIEEATPTVVNIGRLEMPVMSFELFRRIATDAITTPDLLTERDVAPTLTADR